MSADDEVAQPIDVRARIAAFGGGVPAASTARAKPSSSVQTGSKPVASLDDAARTASLPWARAGQFSAGVSEFGVSSSAAGKDRPSTVPYAPYTPYLGGGRSSTAASQSTSSLLGAGAGARSQLRKSDSGASLNELSAAAAARGQASRSRSSSTASSSSAGPARSGTSSPRLGVKSIIALYGAPPDRRGSAESSLSLGPSPRATTPATGGSSSRTANVNADVVSVPALRAGLGADAASVPKRDANVAVSAVSEDALLPSSAPAHLLTGPFTKSASQSLPPPPPQRPAESRSPRALADASSATAAQALRPHSPSKPLLGSAAIGGSTKTLPAPHGPPSLPPRKQVLDTDDRREKTQGLSRERAPRQGSAVPSRSQSDPSEAQDLPAVSPYKVRASTPSSRLHGRPSTAFAPSSVETGGALLQSRSSPPPAPPRPAGMAGMKVAVRQRSHSRLSDSNLYATSERSAAARADQGTRRSAEEADTGLIVPPARTPGAASPVSPASASIPPPRRVRERSSGAATAPVRVQSPPRGIPATSSSAVPPPRHFETATRVAATRSARSPHSVGPRSCAPEANARKRYEALFDGEVRHEALRKTRAQDRPHSTAPHASVVDGPSASADQRKLSARRVARLWRRSRLPSTFLSQVWDAAVASPHEHSLDRESFVRGLAAIDLELGRRRRPLA